MSKKKVFVSIVGGSGYVGGELLRLLLFHPGVEIKQVTSRNFPRIPVSHLHPNLRGLTELKFQHPDELSSCDLLFLTLPNGESMKKIEQWSNLAEKIIDLAADFRFDRQEDWQFWYGSPHQAPEFLNKFTYGLPEVFREKIQSSNYVAGPGCEAVISILCLFPLVKHKLIKDSPIIIDAKMSSSQAGARVSLSSHHPERAGVVRSYKPTGHRHTGEIEKVLRFYSSEISINISATAVEMVRGILVTIHTFLNEKISERHIWEVFRQEYSQEPFIRMIKLNQGLYRFPEPKVVLGTNFCEIGFEIDQRTSRLVIIGAIDNLIKGAAGNAVQCLNLMWDLPETTGLKFPGLHPI